MKRQNLPVVLLAAGAAALLTGLSRKKSGWSDFRGRVALVTGGSRGLGLELARQLAADGARVFICARAADELENAQDILATEGYDVETLQADVTSADEAEGAVEIVVAKAGRIDVLINNAGIIRVGPMESMDIVDYKLAMDTHYWGAVHTTLAALPHMKQHQHGRIVNVASIGGVINPPHLLPYNASKAALIAFSEGCSAEVAGDICITTVSPGLMRSGSPLNADFKGNSDAEFLWFAASDMTPGLSISVEGAARKILAACLKGEPTLTFTLPAKVGAVIHALLPDTTIDVFRWINKLLPASNIRAIRRGRETRGRANLALQERLEAVGQRQNQSIVSE